MEKREYINSRGTPALSPVNAIALGKASMTCPICIPQRHATQVSHNIVNLMWKLMRQSLFRLNRHECVPMQRINH